jgi:P pilus assembly chaperone PapD
MKSKVVVIGILCYLLIFTTSACAIGVGVHPAKIEFKIEDWKNVQKNITVSNPEDIDLTFKVYAENEFKERVNISESLFSLKPQQTKQVNILFMPAADDAKELILKIYVLAMESDGGSNIGSGVKIPVRITKMNESKDIYSLMFVAIIIGLLIVFVSIRRLRKL